MTAQLWWYVARATGIVAWALIVATVVWGLLLGTRLLGGKPTPRWLADLHSFLGGLAVAFTALHLASLVADSAVHFGVRELLVPLASRWRPAPVAAGVVALYLLAAVELTSLARRHLPRRWWRRIHLTSYVAFWLATVHGMAAGTDTTSPWLWSAYTAAAGVVLFLTVYRILGTRGERTAHGARTACAGRTSAGERSGSGSRPSGGGPDGGGTGSDRSVDDRPGTTGKGRPLTRSAV